MLALPSVTFCSWYYRDIQMPSDRMLQNLLNPRSAVTSYGGWATIHGDVARVIEGEQQAKLKKEWEQLGLEREREIRKQLELEREREIRKQLELKLECGDVTVVMLDCQSPQTQRALHAAAFAPLQSMLPLPQLNLNLCCRHQL